MNEEKTEAILHYHVAYGTSLDDDGKTEVLSAGFFVDKVRLPFDGTICNQLDIKEVVTYLVDEWGRCPGLFWAIAPVHILRKGLNIPRIRASNQPIEGKFKDYKEQHDLDEACTEPASLGQYSWTQMDEETKTFVKQIESSEEVIARSTKRRDKKLAPPTRDAQEEMIMRKVGAKWCKCGGHNLSDEARVRSCMVDIFSFLPGTNSLNHAEKTLLVPHDDLNSWDKKRNVLLAYSNMKPADQYPGELEGMSTGIFKEFLEGKRPARTMKKINKRTMLLFANFCEEYTKKLGLGMFVSAQK